MIFSTGLIIQWILVVLDAVAEISSRYIVQNLLQSLERSSHIDRWTWTWVALLPLSLLSVAICHNWSSWIGHTRVQLPMIGLLRSLAFEKSMRLRSANEGTPANEKQKQSAPPSTMDVIENYRYIAATCILRHTYHTNGSHLTAARLLKLS